MLLRTVVCPSVEAEDATVESREELEIFFLRTLHIFFVDRVAVRLEVLESLEYWIGIPVQRVHEGKVHSLGSSVFDCIFHVQGLLLGCAALCEDLLREVFRLYRISRISLYGSDG